MDRKGFLFSAIVAPIMAALGRKRDAGKTTVAVSGFSGSVNCIAGERLEDGDFVTFGPDGRVYNVTAKAARGVANGGEAGDRVTVWVQS
jgi:hypothetical protein